MTPTRWFRACVCLTIVLSASAVGAQDAPKLFVDGVAFAGFENYSHSESSVPIPELEGPGGLVPGGTVGVGTFLAPKVSLRFEASFPGSDEVEYNGPEIYLPVDLTSLYSAYSSVGLTVPIIPQIRYREARSSQSYSMLFAYHQGTSGRLRVSYLAGPAFLRIRESYFRSITYPQLPAIPGIPIIIPPIDEIETTSIYYIPAVVIGADVEIAFGDHFKVLPQVRVVGTNGLLSVRPGIGVRWVP